MKNIFLATALAAIGLTSLAAAITLTVRQEAIAAEKPETCLRHVVFFKFKESATPEQIKAVEDAFAALPGKVASITDFEWGTNVSEEGHDKGFTHCFLVTFADAEGRDAYLPHPAHKEFGKLVGPVLEDVCVIDFVPNGK